MEYEVRYYYPSKDIEKIKDKCATKEVPLEVATKRNPNIKRPSVFHPKRKLFLEDVCIKNLNVTKCAKKYLKVPLCIQIYRSLPQFVKDIIKYKILKMEKK